MGKPAGLLHLTLLVNQDPSATDLVLSGKGEEGREPIYVQASRYLRASGRSGFPGRPEDDLSFTPVQTFSPSEDLEQIIQRRNHHIASDPFQPYRRSLAPTR
jgi:hypothetical protein